MAITALGLIGALSHELLLVAPVGACTVLDVANHHTRPRPLVSGRWPLALAGVRWPMSGGQWAVADERWPVGEAPFSLSAAPPQPSCRPSLRELSVLCSMAVVNRCAIGLAPRQPLIDWSRRISDEAMCWGAEDHSLYLIPSYEDPAEAQAWLEAEYLRMFENELDSWCRDASLWPEPRPYTLFRDWFDVRFYDLVEDISDDELTLDEED